MQKCSLFGDRAREGEREHGFVSKNRELVELLLNGKRSHSLRELVEGMFLIMQCQDDGFEQVKEKSPTIMKVH